jgi:flagellar motility protein MotE (MotC chaperone)
VRLRLIPLVIFAAALFLSVRMGDLWSRVDIVVGGTSVAETAPGKPVDLTAGMNAARARPTTEATKDEAGTAGGAKGQPAKTEPAKTDAAKADAARTGAAGTADKSGAAKPATDAAAAEGAKTEKPAADTRTPEKPAEADTVKAADKAGVDKSGADAKPAGDDAKTAPGKTAGATTVEATPARPILPRKPAKDEALPDPDDMSRGDLKILQELAQRRRELDQREQELAMRDGLLKAAEKRVDEKIAELAAMKTKLEGLVKQREEQQTVQLKSLVKIYENMKPKDAAQIFDELDMTILVELLAHMKEAKSAPIMAAMDPKRVKDVTARLINRRTLGSAADSQGQKTAAR